MTGRVPALGEVVAVRPDLLGGPRRLTAARYVVAQVHDFRDDPDPALYLTIVEESVYRHYIDREGGTVATWSPWHAVVDLTEVARIAPRRQLALFESAA